MPDVTFFVVLLNAVLLGGQAAQEPWKVTESDSTFAAKKFF